MQLRTVARVRHNGNGFGVSRFRDTLHTHVHPSVYADTDETSLWHTYSRMQSSRVRANSAACARDRSEIL